MNSDTRDRVLAFVYALEESDVMRGHLQAIFGYHGYADAVCVDCVFDGESDERMRLRVSALAGYLAAVAETLKRAAMGGETS